MAEVLDESIGSSGNPESITIEGNLSEDIDKLTNALQSVRSAFEMRLKSLTRTMSAFFAITAVVLIVLFIYYYNVINGNWEPDFYNTKPFELTYDIGVRIAMVSSMISVIVYSLKMGGKYLSLCGDIRHKISIINSMPSLLKSGENKELFKSSYNKITDMLIQINENKVEVDNIKVEGLADILKSLIKK